MTSMVQHKNPHIRDMPEDVLYHLGLSTSTHDLADMFEDVKFVCMGGTPQRMRNFAEYIMKEIGYKLPTGSSLEDISKLSHRYAMYKVGPVLSISHGMGVPSLSILLHEVIKLLAHAGAKDPVFFRIGTCGGIGLEGGTVVITNEAVDGLIRPVHDQIVLGKVVGRPTHLDKALIEELLSLGKEQRFSVVEGKTMCTDDFYEGQGRLDGAFCDFTNENKMEYLEKLSDNGVKNIEMEATAFAALTYEAGIRSAVVCVALLNRLNGDQITTTKECMLEWQRRPQALVAAYIKKQLNLRKPPVRLLGRLPTLATFSSYEDNIRNSRLRYDSTTSET